MRYINYYSIRMIFHKFIDIFNKIKSFFFPKTCYDYIFEENIINVKENHNNRPLTINILLPFTISKYSFEKLNKRNNFFIEYINDKEIGIPVSRLIDINDILPLFASNKKSIINILELNTSQIIESYKNSYIYVKNERLGIGNQAYPLSLEIKDFENSSPKRKELGQGNCGFTKFILPNGFIRHPDYYFISFSSIIHYNKTSNYYSAPPNFVIEIKTKNNSLSFYIYKSIEWIKQGVESVLLIDSYGNNDSMGSCYYFCLSQPSPILNQNNNKKIDNNNNNNKPLIPSSSQYIEKNNNLKSINDNESINVIQYKWDNYFFPQKSNGPDIKIKLYGILDGAVLDLLKLENKR